MAIDKRVRPQRKFSVDSPSALRASVTNDVCLSVSHSRKGVSTKDPPIALGNWLNIPLVLARCEI